jgi:predicted transcriptional regulator
MGKTDNLTIRISPELKTMLKDLADADNRTVSNYLEKLIMDAHKKAEKTPS